MKKLLLNLLLSSAVLLCPAQTPATRGEALKIIGIYAGSIALNAIGDGLDDDGKQEWGHLCNATSIGLLLASPFVIDYDKEKWYWYLISYTSLRIAMFDYTYNATRGLPLNQIGTVSFWDRGLQKLNPPNTYLGRGVFMTFGIAIPIKEIAIPHRRNKRFNTQ